MKSRSLSQLAVAVLVTFAVHASRVDAQDPLVAGARVRVLGTDMVAPVVGSFQALRNDTLFFLEDGTGAQRWTVPVRDLKSVEVSKGMGRHDPGKMRKWGVIGAAAGGALGFVASKVLDANSGPAAKYNAGLGTVVGLAIGAGAGVFYGASVSVEKWGSLAVPKRNAGVSRSPGSTYLGVNLKF
jgi:hypothetical protein